MYNLVVVFMVATYPIIWFKRQSRRTTHVKPVPVSSTRGSDVTEPLAYQRPLASSTSNSVVLVPFKKRPTRGFAVLTVLTTSVTICWTPLLVYYTIALFRPVDDHVYFQVATVMYAVEAVLDPIWFMVALPQLRVAVMEMFRLC